MSEAKHTPVPWRTDDNQYIWANDEFVVGQACIGPELRVDEVIANGKLMAAAPELLEACKRAHSCIRDGFEESKGPEDRQKYEREAIETFRQLAAAIAKAEDQTDVEQEGE